MTGPIAALATAHRRMVCGPGLPERLDIEDVEAALCLRRQLDQLGYHIVPKGGER